MKIVKHLEPLESIIKEYEERAGRSKSIGTEIRADVKHKTQETLRRVLIDGDSKSRFYGLTNYTTFRIACG